MLSAIPAQLVAGDTWKWSTGLACYPASAGWALVTSFRGASQLDVSGVASGDEWISTAAATDTATLPPGTYNWQAKVSKADEVYTVAAGSVVIAAALSGVTDPVDGRSQAEKLLAAADAAYLAVLGGKARVQFGDQSYDAHNLSTLADVREKLRMEVAQQRGRNGGRRQILVRFPRA